MKKVIIFCVILLTQVACSTGLQPDEAIIFYPSFAHINSEGNVEANIQAWVYEQELRPGAKEIFSKWLKVDTDQLSKDERDRYNLRTQFFRFDSESNKNITIRFAGSDHEYNLPATNSDGRVDTKIELKNSNLSTQPIWLKYHAILPNSDQRKFEGKVLLLPSEGISVISDIDDTIKDSNVLKQRELLLNTFLHVFKPVAGMAEQYQSWKSDHPNISFHYVSSSPRQLYPALSDFLREQQFPIGTLHLRDIRVSDELFGAETSENHKLSAIGKLFLAFPDRRYVLVGDSGEADPEIYGDIARRFPRQIIAIYIRDVTSDVSAAADQSREIPLTQEDDRYQRAFHSVDSELWQVFKNPDSINFKIFH